MVISKQTLSKYSKLGSDAQTKSYFGIIATLALLIVLLLLIFPAIKHVTSINKEISDARIVKTKLENKLLALNEAKDNLEEVRGDLPLLDLALPIGSDLPNYLIRIERMAKNNGMKLISIDFSNVPLSKPSPQEDVLETKTIIYNVTFEGGFLNFQKFLSKLEDLIRVSDVNILKIEKLEDKPLTETLEVTSYFYGVSFVEESAEPPPQTSETSPTVTTPPLEEINE